LDVLMRDGVEWREEISSDRFSGFWRPAIATGHGWFFPTSVRDKATILFGNYDMTYFLSFSLVLMSLSVT